MSQFPCKASLRCCLPNLKFVITQIFSKMITCFMWCLHLMHHHHLSQFGCLDAATQMRLPLCIVYFSSSVLFFLNLFFSFIKALDCQKISFKFSECGEDIRDGEQHMFLQFFYFRVQRLNQDVRRWGAGAGSPVEILARGSHHSLYRGARGPRLGLLIVG